MQASINNYSRMSSLLGLFPDVQQPKATQGCTFGHFEEQRLHLLGGGWSCRLEKRGGIFRRHLFCVPQFVLTVFLLFDFAFCVCPLAPTFRLLPPLHAMGPSPADGSSSSSSVGRPWHYSRTRRVSGSHVIKWAKGHGHFVTLWQATY